MSGIDEGDNMSNEMGNPWKNERFFSSYEEADTLRKSLLGRDRSATLQVKVKRCGEGGAMYVVKSRQDPNAIAELQEIEEKMMSKKNKSKKK